MAMEEEEDQFCESKSGRNKELEPSSSSSSSFGSPSNSSCFSEDDGDEASSSPPSTSSSSSSSNSSSSSALHANNNINDDSPLYELSQLMAQLPIKKLAFNNQNNMNCESINILNPQGFYFGFCRRGLSRFYQGKSQSYTSLLGSVNSLDDLAKKRVANSGRILKMKTKCRSFCWGLERQKHCYGPKPAISKKGSSTSRGSSSSCFTSLQFPRPPAPSPSSSVSLNTAT